VLRGSVQINGTAAAANFASADLAFAYASDESNTWFLLQEIDQPVSSSLLGTWDTTAISDGEYLLRVRVVAQDGTSLEARVAVQVRNYTSAVDVVASATPTVVPPVQVPAPIVIVASATSAPAIPAVPTALPANPAAVSESAVYGVFSRGALLVAVLVLVLGVILLRRQA